MNKMTASAGDKKDIEVSPDYHFTPRLGGGQSDFDLGWGFRDLFSHLNYIQILKMMLNLYILNVLLADVMRGNMIAVVSYFAILGQNGTSTYLIPTKLWYCNDFACVLPKQHAVMTHRVQALEIFMTAFTYRVIPPLQNVIAGKRYNLLRSNIMQPCGSFLTLQNCCNMPKILKVQTHQRLMPHMMRKSCHLKEDTLSSSIATVFAWFFHLSETLYEV